MFDGLLPQPHNKEILQLLFVCAHWHALAKLRMHTDYTLNIFDDTTILIGAKLRAFEKKTCSAFATHELKRETEARKRRANKAQRNSTTSKADAKRSSGSDQQLPKKFNLQTYKHHSLGDYPNTIRQYGTTDSYSTEPVRDLFNVTPRRIITDFDL